MAKRKDKWMHGWAAAQGVHVRVQCSLSGRASVGSSLSGGAGAGLMEESEG